MDGSHFLTVNPSTLDDDTLWSYGELQKLCKNLGLKASGKRSELERRLTEWHKARTTEGHTVVVDEEGTEKIPLNVDGSNFSLLGMHLKVKSQNGSGCTSPEGAFSVQLGVGSPTVVSPTLLKPLAPSTPVRTPKSALKKSMGGGGGSEVKASRIKFSPYNATKFIPNRREGNEAWVVDNASLRRTSDDDDDDELDWEAESGYVDETARINAEKNVFVCSMDGGWENDF
jgi:hypothetical protein